MSIGKRLALLLAIVACESSVHAAVISHHVDSLDNLYFTDWGHPYNVPPFDPSNNELGALGRGDPAGVVSDTTGAANFAGFRLVILETSGSIAINSATLWNPDGDDERIFRGLPVYSLIGVWSRSSTIIDPIGEALFVGSQGNFPVPRGPSAYLWLGFNDGKFEDNLDAPLFGGPGFDTPNIKAIPEPASSGLLLLGLGFLVLRRGMKCDGR